MRASLSAKRTQQICTEQILCVYFSGLVLCVSFMSVVLHIIPLHQGKKLAIGGQPSRRKLIHIINAKREQTVKTHSISEKHIINGKKKVYFNTATWAGLLVAFCCIILHLCVSFMNLLLDNLH